MYERIIAEISSGVYSLPSNVTFLPEPIKRLIELTELGLVTT